MYRKVYSANRSIRTAIQIILKCGEFSLMQLVLLHGHKNMSMVQPYIQAFYKKVVSKKVLLSA